MPKRKPGPGRRTRTRDATASPLTAALATVERTAALTRLQAAMDEPVLEPDLAFVAVRARVLMNNRRRRQLAGLPT